LVITSSFTADPIRSKKTPMDKSLKQGFYELRWRKPTKKRKYICLGIVNTSSKQRSPVGSLNWCAARATPHPGAWNPRVVVNLRIEELTKIINNSGDANEKDPSGRTPLMYVAAGDKIYKDLTGINMPGKEKATKALLELGADPKEKNNDGNSVVEYFHTLVGAEHPSTILVIEASRAVR